MPNFNIGSDNYSDGTQIQANQKNHWVEFYHIPSGQSVSFKAFLNSFSDDYKSNWNMEEVFGRMDPIPTFKNTTRTITFDWEVPAATLHESKDNLAKVSKLYRMLYPVYDNHVIKAAPLFKVRMMNLISSTRGARRISDASSTGLIAIIDGFSYNPDLEVGVFEQPGGKIYPKNIKMQCSMTIQHEKTPGFAGDGSPIEPSFPYGEHGTTDVGNAESAAWDGMVPEPEVGNDGIPESLRRDTFTMVPDEDESPDAPARSTAVGEAAILGGAGGPTGSALD